MCKEVCKVFVHICNAMKVIQEKHGGGRGVGSVPLPSGGRGLRDSSYVSQSLFKDTLISIQSNKLGWQPQSVTITLCLRSHVGWLTTLGC